jgi:hypothetical protein
MFPLKQKKMVFFLCPNSFKKGKLLGDRFFASAAEFFFCIGRKVLQRVGNTLVTLADSLPVPDQLISDTGYG